MGRGTTSAAVVGLGDLSKQLKCICLQRTDLLRPGSESQWGIPQCVRYMDSQSLDNHFSRKVAELEKEALCGECPCPYIRWSGSRIGAGVGGGWLEDGELVPRRFLGTNSPPSLTFDVLSGSCDVPRGAATP